MFWLNNLNELIKPVFIPTDDMILEEKLNTIVRLILFIGLIAAFVFNDSRFILFIIIMLIFSVIIYSFNIKQLELSEKFLEKKNLDVIDNKLCVKPTKENPFMNPTLLDISYNPNKPDACNIDNEKVSKSINDNFYSRVYRTAGDIYNNMSSERQYYTVPSTSIPNDRESLGEWLYQGGKSCKENNGIKCYNNLFNSLR